MRLNAHGHKWVFGYFNTPCHVKLDERFNKEALRVAFQRALEKEYNLRDRLEMPMQVTFPFGGCTLSAYREVPEPEKKRR